MLKIFQGIFAHLFFTMAIFLSSPFYLWESWSPVIKSQEQGFAATEGLSIVGRSLGRLSRENCLLLKQHLSHPTGTSESVTASAVQNSMSANTSFSGVDRKGGSQKRWMNWYIWEVVGRAAGWKEVDGDRAENLLASLLLWPWLSS